MTAPAQTAPAAPADTPVSVRDHAPRRWEAVVEAVLPPVVALLVALVVGDLLILSFGQSPAAVYRLLLEGTWGNPYGIGQVLYKATTLTFTGLAVAVGIRAGLFNIGAEGQLAAGGFAAAVPGVLRARFGAHEVITTIMLNFVVLALLGWIVSARLHVPESLHTPEIRSGAVPRLSDIFPVFHGSAANLTLLLALLVAAGVGWYLFRTKRGYELRAVGLQPDAAEYGGVEVGSVRWRALTLSGALAGLGGVNFVLGYKHYYEDGFAAGSGFLGIAVALVGRNNPFGVVVAALLFATLSQGGLAVNALVPKQMVEVLQAVVILAVATAVPAVKLALRSGAHDRKRAMSTGSGVGR